MSTGAEGVAGPPAWPGTLFRAALRPTLAAGAVAAVVALVVAGPRGLGGSLLGTALVVGTFGAGLAVARATAHLHPSATMAAAVGSYVLKITLLLLVLVLVRRTGVVDGDAAGLSVLVAALVWLTAEVLAFTRLQLTVDPGAAPPERTSDPG